MANSTDMAYQRDMFLLSAFSRGCSIQPSENLKDYDNAIQEYEALLDDAIWRNDKQEIQQLRKEIQQTRAEKRIAKRMIDTKQKEMRVAYS